MTHGTRGFCMAMFAALLVVGACASGEQTCDTGINNRELCSDWVESKNATREACGQDATLDVDETCDGYESLDDPAVCGDCTEYFECLSSLTSCVDGGVVEGSISDCPSACE